jgi:hypothetical protein
MMTIFFSTLYEWFGLIAFYSNDLADHLRGWDMLCEDHTGTPWYVYVGWLMLLVVGLAYVFQYHVYDRSHFNKKQHWWLMALIVVILNFLIAFTFPYNSLQAGDHCMDLHWSIPDCAGFGLSNALWSFIFFAVITSLPFPRRLSTNCSHTTLLTP